MTPTHAAEASGRYLAVLIRPDGAVTHLNTRERMQEAVDDADAKGPAVDAQVLALQPRRVVASREPGAAWRRA